MMGAAHEHAHASLFIHFFPNVLFLRGRAVPQLRASVCPSACLRRTAYGGEPPQVR